MAPLDRVRGRPTRERSAREPIRGLGAGGGAAHLRYDPGDSCIERIEDGEPTGTTSPSKPSEIDPATPANDRAACLQHGIGSAMTRRRMIPIDPGAATSDLGPRIRTRLSSEGNRLRAGPGHDGIHPSGSPPVPVGGI